MLAVERRNKIEEIINERKSVLVSELAKQFDVTTETIRADLEKLEKAGVLVRTYGGATLLEENEPGIMDRDVINYEGKEKIGRRAAELINDGETIFLDASTSALHLARCIKTKRALTIITNAEKVVAELSSCAHINVICVGGRLEPKNMSFTGRVAQSSVRDNYFADKFFFSCRGLSTKGVLADSSENEAEVKKVMLENSSEAIFLCDYKKIGRLGLSKITELNDVDCIVTDRPLDDEWKRLADRNGVKTVYA